MVNQDQLPIELECFLLKWGFFERDRAPGAIKHQQITKPKKQNKGVPESVAWTPSYQGEQPPF